MKIMFTKACLLFICVFLFLRFACVVICEMLPFYLATALVHIG